MMSSGAKILLLPWKCQDFEHMHQSNHNTSTALMQSDKKCETWAILVQGHLLCSKRWYTTQKAISGSSCLPLPGYTMRCTRDLSASP